MKLIGNICLYNESAKGNLRRCLDNMKHYCDDIVIWDDGSTDNSVEIASHYTSQIMGDGRNDQMNELAHKQAMLERSVELGATHVFWLDCDETLDLVGTAGGLRALCEGWPDDLDAYSFPEVNLWRSQTWARTDTLFAKARFVRLWKVVPGIRFAVHRGVHSRLYPATIERVVEAPFRVLHYGFWDYLPMMEKIGAHLMDKEELHECARENWILDERKCNCYRVPLTWYPCENEPTEVWPLPLPRKIESLETATELWKHRPLIDPATMKNWGDLHSKDYHGDSVKIWSRNLDAWKNPAARGARSLFGFDPRGKSIIDIGAGGGWFALDCLRMGAGKVTLLEINAELIGMAAACFRDLWVYPLAYEFILIAPGDPPVLAKADIIYSLAVFQHLSWQLCRSWFRWTARHLAHEGRAYFQFHREIPGGLTTFANSEQKIGLAMLEQDLSDAGLKILSCRIAEGEDLVPAWWMYELGGCR